MCFCWHIERLELTFESSVIYEVIAKTPDWLCHDLASERPDLRKRAEDVLTVQISSHMIPPEEYHNDQFRCRFSERLVRINAFY